jgi:hypothetical protein
VETIAKEASYSFPLLVVLRCVNRQLRDELQSQCIECLRHRLRKARSTSRYLLQEKTLLAHPTKRQRKLLCDDEECERRRITFLEGVVRQQRCVLRRLEGHKNWIVAKEAHCVMQQQEYKEHTLAFRGVDVAALFAPIPLTCSLCVRSLCVGCVVRVVVTCLCWSMRTDGSSCRDL